MAADEKKKYITGIKPKDDDDYTAGGLIMMHVYACIGRYCIAHAGKSAKQPSRSREWQIDVRQLMDDIISCVDNRRPVSAH